LVDRQSEIGNVTKLFLVQIIGEKDADGFYWGECGGLSGYVPCNMISEVQVDDERVARELLKVRGWQESSSSICLDP
jgi:hypothetical protein